MTEEEALDACFHQVFGKADAERVFSAASSAAAALQQVRFGESPGDDINVLDKTPKRGRGRESYRKSIADQIASLTSDLSI